MIQINEQQKDLFYITLSENDKADEKYKMRARFKQNNEKLKLLGMYREISYQTIQHMPYAFFEHM